MLENKLYRTVRVALLIFIGVSPSAFADQNFGCLIEPGSIIDLSTREEGIIDRILVNRGDLVEAGEVLVHMEADVEQATVDLAEVRAQMKAELDERQNDIGLTQRELERLQALFEKKAISYTEVDRAETEARRAKLRLEQSQHRQRVARLELERAKRLLERRTLFSPVNGMVIERLLAPGESIEQATVLRIAELNPLNVEVILPVERFGEIRKGQLARIMPRYPGAESHQATVIVVDSVVDSASDTFGVRLQLTNEDYAIPAGVRCEIEF